MVGNLLIGVVASLLTVIILWVYKRLRFRRYFGSLNGLWNQYEIDGTPIVHEQTKLTYLGGTVFKTENTNSDKTKKWEGTLVMQEDNPFFGQGIYKYQGRIDWGIHQVQVSADRKCIYVYYQNQNHSKGKYGGLVWKKTKTT